MHDPSWIEDDLADLGRQGLLRSLETAARPSGCLSFDDNDYLDLARHPEVTAGAAAAAARYGAGARAARLLGGNLDCHRELEQRLAQLKGCPAALIFGSGFLANLGVMTALAGRGDTVILDRLAHASLIDGARLSGARLLRFRHNDPDHLTSLLQKTKPSTGRRLVVTESVFSMDGDRAPLNELAQVATAHHAILLVDEAHATGVFGYNGSGLFHPGDFPDLTTIAIGTLSKALGAYGGFAAGSEKMCHYLLQRARPFVYSTAPPPPVIGAALAALEICRKQRLPGRTLLQRAARFRRRLQKGGVDTGPSDSQIVPVILGDSQRALRVSASLREHGIFCPAIRPPTVPPGRARIRFSITCRHQNEDLDRAADLTLSVMGGG